MRVVFKKSLMLILVVSVFMTTLLICQSETVSAKTYKSLPNGKYYYTDTFDYGKTTIKIKKNKLIFKGELRDLKTLTVLKTGKFKLKLKKKVKLVQWQEGSSRSIKLSQFNSAVKNGAAIDFKVKNKKVTRIDISPETVK